MIEIIRKRLTGKEEGFTLIELLVVIVILGILLAIAVPSYMGFRDRAQAAAAKANVRAAVPSVEAYFQDTNSYANMTLALLQAIDAGIKLEPLTPALQTLNSYCISADGGGGHWAGKAGPAADILDAAANPC